MRPIYDEWEPSGTFIEVYMAATIQASQIVDRAVSSVFHFYADEHVRNHPRWDPDIQLENPSGEPLRVGTILRRTNTRGGTPVEGTMEVTEFERDRSIAMLIHDGPVETRGRATFEALDANRTRVSVAIEIPGMDASRDTSFMSRRLQRTVDTLKNLIETGL
jgi:hypothetical protein